MKRRWFLSGVGREAAEMCKHVGKLLDAQHDLLSSHAIDAVSSALEKTQQQINDGAEKEVLRKSMSNLETVANKWIKPYPNAKWRENVEVFLVAIAVAMAIRTFFLQPFKIPTGSLQPTLYGITPSPEEYSYNPNSKLPTGIKRFVDAWVYGISTHHVVAKTEGDLEEIE